MYKLLEKLKNEKTLCEIYTNNFDGFSVGNIMCVSDSWFMISSYAPNGKWDGYLLLPISLVCRVAYNTLYLEKIKRFIVYEDVIYPFKPSENSIIMSALNYLKSVPKLAKIEILNDRDMVIIGHVKDIDDDYLFVEEVDNYGNKDGCSVIKISDISFLEFDAEEEKLLQKSS